MSEGDEQKQRKLKAKDELDAWEVQRSKQIAAQHNVNQQMQQQFFEDRETKRSGVNPWDRVVENCEMTAAQYVGGADVARMRQAMIARKNDVTKAGGMNKVAIMGKNLI